MTSSQKIFTYAGIALAIYILFVYVVPFILKLIGAIFGFLLKLILFVGVIFAVIVGLSFLVRAARR